MLKRKTIETVEEFDENGKLVRKMTTETEETDDNSTWYNTTTTPVQLPSNLGHFNMVLHVNPFTRKDDTND